MSLGPPKPALLPGHQLDRYELLALIAEGGMGQVWLARLVGKRGFEKLVAIKTLLPKYAADIKFQQMFLDEARIASGIEHANVAQILDLGEQNDVLYLVMELVDGDALSKLARVLTKNKIPFPIPIGLRIIADTCAGIHVAHELRGPDGHELGIVHRDISPQNILVTTTGVAKLIDFGIAKARDRFSGETSEGILKGKIHYMSREQALGRKMDRRADVFALGAILYQLFAGRPAYDGESQLEILHILTSGRPPLPLPATVPRAVSAVIYKALASVPEERFQTALEMQRAINKAMNESNLGADTSDVAAFVKQHLAERTQRRRQAIELALKAAADRAAANAALLTPGSPLSSPGTVVPFGAITPAPATRSQLSSEPQLANGPAGAQSVSEVQAVEMRAAVSVAMNNKRKRGVGRVALAGAAVVVLVAGVSIVAVRSRTVGASINSTTSNIPPAIKSSTPPLVTSAPPLSTPTSSVVVEEASVDAGVAIDISTLPHSSYGGQRPHTPAGKPSAHPTATSAPSATAAPRPTSNTPDFGY